MQLLFVIDLNFKNFQYCFNIVYRFHYFPMFSLTHSDATMKVDTITSLSKSSVVSEGEEFDKTSKRDCETLHVDVETVNAHVHSSNIIGSNTDTTPTITVARNIANSSPEIICRSSHNRMMKTDIDNFHLLSDNDTYNAKLSPLHRDVNDCRDETERYKKVGENKPVKSPMEMFSDSSPQYSYSGDEQIGNYSEGSDSEVNEEHDNLHKSKHVSREDEKDKLFRPFERNSPKSRDGQFARQDGSTPMSATYKDQNITKSESLDETNHDSPTSFPLKKLTGLLPPSNDLNLNSRFPPFFRSISMNNDRNLQRLPKDFPPYQLSMSHNIQSSPIQNWQEGERLCHIQCLCCAKFCYSAHSRRPIVASISPVHRTFSPKRPKCINEIRSLYHDSEFRNICKVNSDLRYSFQSRQQGRTPSPENGEISNNIHGRYSPQVSENRISRSGSPSKGEEETTGQRITGDVVFRRNNGHDRAQSPIESTSGIHHRSYEHSTRYELSNFKHIHRSNAFDDSLRHEMLKQEMIRAEAFYKYSNFDKHAPNNCTPNRPIHKTIAPGISSLGSDSDSQKMTTASDYSQYHRPAYTRNDSHSCAESVEDVHDFKPGDSFASEHHRRSGSCEEDSVNDRIECGDDDGDDEFVDDHDSLHGDCDQGMYYYFVLFFFSFKEKKIAFL